MLKPLTYTVTAIAALTGALALAPGTIFGAQVIHMPRKALTLLLSCTGLLCLAAPSGALPDAINFGGATPDAATVYFVDNEPLVAADTDSNVDVYQRSGGVTTLVSLPGAGATPPSQNIAFAGATNDGSAVFLSTTENLVAADTDGLADVYQRSGAVTTLVSALGLGSSGSPQGATFKAVSADNSTVFFDTKENLVTADTDGLFDIYARSGGVTSLVSAPGVGSSGSPAGASFAKASSDGSVVDFTTPENLVAADTDGLFDVYERSGGTTTLVSAPGAGANGPATHASFQGVTADGATVIFDTAENLVAADTDGLEDVYQRSAGTTTLISEPGAGASGPAGFEAFAGMSADASKVIFDSPENLVAADTDGLNDVYQHSGGVTTLLSAEGVGASGPISEVDYLGNSTDASIVFFDTDENFVAADVDGTFDIYKRSAGTTTLETPAGSGPAAEADYEDNSADGSSLFFDSTENLVAEDTDGIRDTYVTSAGVTTLVSAPGAGAAGPPALPSLTRVSTDGSRAIFLTAERMTGADGDVFQDLYERASGTTTLLSVEAGPPLGVAPDTAISSGPSSSTSDTSATFSFTSTEPATFECRMDGGSFSGCTSPFSASGLSVGGHTFEVRSADFAGNVDPTPAALAFTVVAPPAATPTPKHCKKGQKLKKGKCVKKKHKK
jgi:hypothetical protein